VLHFVEFQSGRNTLRGMLHLPGGPGRHACVMLCHSFTGNRLESHFLFVTIAPALDAAGLACLRFNFAGSGESDGDFVDMTTAGEVAAAHLYVQARAVRALPTQLEILPDADHTFNKVEDTQTVCRLLNDFFRANLRG
jgi:pimeloyl-ACP methyl ester carboxylesterase